jgi:glycerophosphoryl diester phosphodiesterase
MPRTLIAAHRGGADLWPENSLLAFRQTAGMPVELVEFDVHRTSDGILVVHHDATIDRMTDGTGAIASMSFAELSRHVIRGTGGERIPTLAEVVAVFRDSPVDLRLEIKTGVGFRLDAGIEAEVAEFLHAQGMLSRTMLTSFMLPVLSEARQALVDHTTLGLVWLVSPMALAGVGRAGVIEAARTHGVREVGFTATDLTDDLAEFFGSQGFTVHAWAAHTREAASQMFALNVASFTTDRPDLAIEARGEFARG